MPKQQSKTRDERRKERSNNYLGGKARKAFSHTPVQCEETTEASSSLLDQRGIYAQNAYLFFLGLQICSWSLLTEDQI